MMIMMIVDFLNCLEFWIEAGKRYWNHLVSKVSFTRRKTSQYPVILILNFSLIINNRKENTFLFPKNLKNLL